MIIFCLFFYQARNAPQPASSPQQTQPVATSSAQDISRPVIKSITSASQNQRLTSQAPPLPYQVPNVTQAIVSSMSQAFQTPQSFAYTTQRQQPQNHFQPIHPQQQNQFHQHPQSQQQQQQQVFLNQTMSMPPQTSIASMPPVSDHGQGMIQVSQHQHHQQPSYSHQFPGVPFNVPPYSQHQHPQQQQHHHQHHHHHQQAVSVKNSNCTLNFQLNWFQLVSGHMHRMPWANLPQQQQQDLSRNRSAPQIIQNPQQLPQLMPYQQQQQQQRSSRSKPMARQPQLIPGSIDLPLYNLNHQSPPSNSSGDSTQTPPPLQYLHPQ